MINAVRSKVELIAASLLSLLQPPCPEILITENLHSSLVFKRKDVFSTFPCFFIFSNPFCLSGTFCKRDFW